MKELLLWIGWILAAFFGFLNYKQSHELKRLRALINETKAAQARDHDLYREVLKDFGSLFGDEIQKRNIAQRVDMIFARAQKKADDEKTHQIK